ncbi:MAG: protein kinase, partial [Actinomycetota bacterium]
MTHEPSQLLRDRYEPIESIGSGGQGEVLRALDHQHERQVALKIRPAGTDEQRRVLLSEARILLGLRPHHGVPLVRDDFFADDRYVIVMDWVEGTDLRDLIETQGDPGLPVASVLRYITDIAEALDHLHSHEPPIVHGDVKPANCILTMQGRVVLVDFGIALGAGSAYAHGSGTRGFVAPEVATGQPSSPAGDIFGLAALAFALLTGRAPEGEWPDFEGIAAPVARALGRAIRLGLSYDPARRPRTAGEFAERLRSWQEATLPTGTVTFLFTDIESSTPLWDEHGAEMPRVIARHEQIVANAVEENGGRFVKSRGEGDSTLSVFTKASDGVVAALAVQRELAAEQWPSGIEIHVRAGLHTGEAELREGDYYGSALNRAARIRSAARGGEIYLSQTTAQLVADVLPAEATLTDLGARELKGLTRPEEIFELRHPDVPTIPSAPHAPDVPVVGVPASRTTFIGRDEELSATTERVVVERLVTLTGPGGSGKTRLALETSRAAGLTFHDGMSFVDLTAVTDDALVGQALATALDVRDMTRSPTDAVVANISDRSILLVVDNCEQVIDGAATAVDALLTGCPNLHVLATSREPLGVAGEVVTPVPPMGLPSDDE